MEGCFMFQWWWEEGGGGGCSSDEGASFLIGGGAPWGHIGSAGGLWKTL